jgi:hypothetical protein
MPEVGPDRAVARWRCLHGTGKFGARRRYSRQGDKAAAAKAAGAEVVGMDDPAQEHQGRQDRISMW